MSLPPPKPRGFTGVLQFIYTEAGFVARFEPPTPPTVTLLGTSCSPTIFPILSHEEQRSSCLTIAPHRSLGAIVESSDGNNLPKGSVPLTRSAPCPPAFSVTDCGELGRKWLPLFKSYVPQTQSYDGQRTSKLSSWRNTLTALSSSCHSTDSRAMALKVDSSIWGKTRLPSNPLLFTPVSCAECIDSISYFLNHKTRCAPSRPIYMDWIHAI